MDVTAVVLIAALLAACLSLIGYAHTPGLATFVVAVFSFAWLLLSFFLWVSVSSLPAVEIPTQPRGCQRPSCSTSTNPPTRHTAVSASVPTSTVRVHSTSRRLSTTPRDGH